MNTQAVTTEINRLLDSVNNFRQYPTSKEQDETLKALGLFDLMPKRMVKNGTKFIGYTDAATIISAAHDKGKGVMNAHGEGEATGSSTLYDLLNEKPAPSPEPKPSNDDILSDVAEYQESQSEDYWDMQNEIVDVSYETPAKRKVAHAALKAKIEHGKAYHEQNYRVQWTPRHVALSDADMRKLYVPADALASRRVSAGFAGQTETYRLQYLIRAEAADLISLSEAAEMLYGEVSQANRVKLTRLIEDGLMMKFADASEPNPQRRTRVSRKSVELLKSKVAK